MKTLVLGLGNPVISDDSVGLRVAEKVKELLADRADVEVDEDFWGGLRLMERLIGYDRAVIVDAMKTGGEPGTVRLLTPTDLPTQRSASAHDVNFPTALTFGRQTGMHLPPDELISLVGIEVVDILTFGEELTPAVEAAIPRAVELVIKALEN